MCHRFQFTLYKEKSKQRNMAIAFKYSPHKFQQQVHISCSEKSKNFWTIVCSGRQSGKSTLAKYQTINWAIKNANNLIWYVTPSESQSKVVFRDIVSILLPLNVIKTKNQSKGNIVIELINGARIEFKSAASEDTLRGSSVNFMILDEAAFIKQTTIEEIILPTMAAAGKKILVISTPKGKNFFYVLWLRGQTDNEDYESYRFTSFDNPRCNKQLIESFRLSLPEGIFSQEFLAEWVDSNSVFNNVSELSHLNPISGPIKGDSYYVGVDIALLNDFYVLTIINQRGEMVYVDRTRGLEAPVLIERIQSAYKLFKPKTLVIEANNQGLPIIQHIKKTIPNVKGFNTTSETKGDIINQLISAFSSKEIKVLNNEDLKTELNAFIFKYSVSGKIKFEAANGFHDDMVMSLAIAYDSYLKNKTGGGYHVYSNDVAPESMKEKSSTGLFLGKGEYGSEDVSETFW